MTDYFIPLAHIVRSPSSLVPLPIRIQYLVKQFTVVVASLCICHCCDGLRIKACCTCLFLLNAVTAAAAAATGGAARFWREAAALIDVVDEETQEVTAA